MLLLLLLLLLLDALRLFASRRTSPSASDGSARKSGDRFDPPKDTNTRASSTRA